MISDHSIDMLFLNNTLEISEENFNCIVRCIKKRKKVIIFNSYWNHDAVRNLSENYLHCLSDDDLAWYIDFLLQMIDGRPQTHWVERMNIFHSIGLAARKNVDMMRDIINKRYLPHCNDRINNFVDYSAINMMCISSSDFDSSIKIIDKLTSNISLMRGIGQYNIHYYNDVLKLAKQMNAYLDDDNKKAMVPQTIASVLSVMVDTEYEDEEVDAVNDILLRLNKTIQRRVHKMLKSLR